MENVKVPSCHGLTSYSRQAFATVLWLIPRRAASKREDQCVTPSFFGGGASVAATIARWSIRRGRPDRSWLASPSMPASV